MENLAETAYPVNDLIARRWSPRAYLDRPVEREKLLALLEGARWAASSYNAQPWRFLVVTKDDPAAYNRVLGCLIEFNQKWASAAPVLMVSFAQKNFAHNGNPNRHASHDVGQAAASMAIQATALGLQIHQMAGFSPEAIQKEFNVPDEFEPMSAIAVGYPGEPDSLPEELREREKAPRSRNTIDQIAFVGKWGEPLLKGDIED